MPRGIVLTPEVAMPRLLEYETKREGLHVSPMVSTPWLAFLFVASLWFAAMFGSLLLPVPIILFALLLARRRWRLVALSAALSPMGVGFVLGVIGYLTGTAKIHGMGLPGMGYYNVDPQLRCERSTGGCFVNGGEVLTQTPTNWAIVGLTRLFGPQRGAYTGPYPDETQAKAALALSGRPVSIELIAQDQVDVRQPPVKLDAGVGQALLRTSYLTVVGGKLDTFSRDWLKETGSPTAALYLGQCLVLRIPTTSATSAMIVLIDTKSGRPFAYYAEGEFFQRYPPVAWTR